jgi:hypothetical protein
MTIDNSEVFNFGNLVVRNYLQKTEEGIKFQRLKECMWTRLWVKLL